MDSLLDRRGVMMGREIKRIPMKSFGGLNISLAPLYYGAGGFEIKDYDWNHDSYGGVVGTTVGSYCFGWVELGKFFDSRGASFSNSSGNIDNANTITYNGLQGWRLPTKSELESFITTSSSVREGSTVNGEQNKHFALIQLSGVLFSGTQNPMGVLLFPDGETIEGKALSYDKTNALTNGVTNSELNNYLSQGCVFIPASGNCTNGNYSNGGAQSYWYSTDKNNQNTFYGLYFYITGLRINTGWTLAAYRYPGTFLVRTI